MTLLPPGRLQKVLGEVQSSSRFSCYFLPSKLLSAQGHLFISLKREESSHIQQPFSLSESVSATDNINESMIRLQTIERLLLSPGGELPAIEILLSFDIIPSDGAILRMLDLCPELDSQLSNDVIVFKLRGGLLQCSQRGWGMDQLRGGLLQCSVKPIIEIIISIAIFNHVYRKASKSLED